MALHRAHLVRLPYISQNSLSCVFPVRTSHEEDPWQVLEGGKGAAAVPSECQLTDTIADLLTHLTGLKKQLVSNSSTPPHPDPRQGPSSFSVYQGWVRCVCLTL